MDEVSPSGETRVWEVRDGAVTSWTITPARYGLECEDLDGLAGGEPAQNAERLERLLAGEGATVESCAVLLNAAAALYVSANGRTQDESVARARDALARGGGGGGWGRVGVPARRGTW
jgi:anthranilate phosphoribosyltransferase